MDDFLSISELRVENKNEFDKPCPATKFDTVPLSVLMG